MQKNRGVKLSTVGAYALMTALAGSLSFGAMLVSPAASAADIYQGPGLKDYGYMPAPIWSGLYVGGHVGGSWGKSDVTDTYTYESTDPTVKNSISGTNITGGAQIGYNIQRGRLVYGIEADIGGLDLSGDKSATLFQNSAWANPNTGYWLNAKYSLSTGLYGDITGRLGYAAERNLFYVKGGAAFLNLDTSAHYEGGHWGCTTPTNCGNGGAAKFDFDNSDTMWGWTVGAGVEHSLSPSWSLKAEYQHFDFGTTSYGHDKTSPWSNQTATLTGKADADVTADSVTVGVNYHLK